jgi:hypothetical protein
MTKLFPLVLLVGCADVSMTSNTLVTHDETGAEVDVDVGGNQAELRSAGRTALVMWTDTDAVLEAAGKTIVFASADERGVWSPQADDAAFAAYSPMLSAGDQAMLDAGVVLPWHSGITVSASYQCQTWSTWVLWGNNCSKCQDAVNDLRDGYGDSWSNTDSSCSSGSLSTSCSQTWCRTGGGEEMLLE